MGKVIAEPISRAAWGTNPGKSLSRFKRTRVASPKEFDRRSFRIIDPGKPGGHKMIVACPIGKWDAKRKRCKVGMEVQSVLTEKKRATTRGKAKKAKKRKNPLLMVVPNAKLPRRLFKSDRQFQAYKRRLKKAGATDQFFKTKAEAQAYASKVNKTGRVAGDPYKVEGGYLVGSTRFKVHLNNGKKPKRNPLLMVVPNKGKKYLGLTRKQAQARLKSLRASLAAEKVFAKTSSLRDWAQRESYRGELEDQIRQLKELLSPARHKATAHMYKAKKNPPKAWHKKQVEQYRKRMADDLKAKHKGGADYWQGATSAESRALAKHGVNSPRLRKLMAIVKRKKAGYVDRVKVSTALAGAILKVYSALDAKGRKAFGKASLQGMAQVAKRVAARC